MRAKLKSVSFLMNRLDMSCLLIKYMQRIMNIHHKLLFFMLSCTTSLRLFKVAQRLGEKVHLCKDALLSCACLGLSHCQRKQSTAHIYTALFFVNRLNVFNQPRVLECRVSADITFESLHF